MDTYSLPHRSIMCLHVFFMYISFSLAQEATQSIRGIVVDNATEEPLSGISVELLNFVPLKSILTDDNGSFKLNNIPVGKYRLLVSHDRYDIVIVPEVEVLAGKQAAVEVSLEKLPAQIAEIVVKADKIRKTTKDNPINHMALTGIRSFTIEEVKRYPSSLDDPSRLVARFAGVSKTHEQTGLVVRGHSAQSVLWRLEGIPIMSPNHIFFNEASNGYLPIFNIYLLRNSDFMHGIYPAEYGNAIGGLLDLSLREGNRDAYEGSIKVGILGIEGFVEGPLGKKGKASFVAGGRFNPISFLRGRLPGSLGNFPGTTDFSFKVTSSFKKDKLTVFGIGGLSDNTLNSAVIGENELGSQFPHISERRKTFLLGGVSYKKYLPKKGYVHTSIGSNYNREYHHVFDSTSTKDIIDSRTLMTTLNSYLHYVVNPKHQVRAGITASHYYLNFRSENLEDNILRRNYQGNTMLLQVHAQWLYSITKKLKLNLGVNGQYLSFNNTYGVSPRLSVSWQLLASHRLSLGYGWNHQMQAWETYLNRSQRLQDFGQMSDADLGFNKNHHISLTYDWAILNNFRLKLEGYFQYLYDMPMNQIEPNASLFNTTTTYELLSTTHFENTGIGRSYGVELTLEKFFSEGYYGMLTATFFDVKCLGANQEWLNSETSNHVIANLLFGKEFKIGKEKNNTFFIDIAYTFKMGNYYTPVNLAASIAADKQVLDWDRAYALRHPHFHNLDIRLGCVFNQKKKALSHRLLFEFTNALNQRVVHSEFYDPTRQTYARLRYLGILPNISYRLNFAFKKKEK